MLSIIQLQYIDLNAVDYIITPFVLLLIYYISYRIKKNNIDKNPEYYFFVKGLLVKLFGGLFLCFIYIFYYDYGDTIDYWYGANDLADLLISKPSVYFSVFLGNLSSDNFWQFETHHYWGGMWRDPLSFSIIRFTSLISYLGFKSYFVMTLLIACFSYIGVWKLFQLFYRLFPEIRNKVAFSLLFIPSVFFWGSGIVKDSYTLCATAWLVYSCYRIFILKENIFKNLFTSLFCGLILLSIRPFMLYLSLMGVIFMLTHNYLKNAKGGGFYKTIVLIFVFAVICGGGLVLLTNLGKVAGGEYSTIDNMLQKASVTQQDLKRAEYGGNSFDIGYFEPTITGILSKAPKAIIAGLYRPFIWECKNPVMVISGLENLGILLASLYVLLVIIVAIFKTGPKQMILTLFDNSLVVFSLVFSISYAFMVGLTTANFGALVRYKIPLIPFFLASLFIMIHKYNRSTVETSIKKR